MASEGETFGEGFMGWLGGHEYTDEGQKFIASAVRKGAVGIGGFTVASSVFDGDKR
jgi:hypothetical protein